MNSLYENVTSLNGGVEAVNDEAMFVLIDELIRCCEVHGKMPCVFRVGGSYHIGMSGGIDDEEVVLGEYPFMDSFSTEEDARELLADNGATGVTIYWT